MDAKEAAKEQKNKEKQEAVEKATQENFEAKKRDGSKGTTIDKLKVWLDNTPFKSNNTQLKRDTLVAIMTNIMALKANEIENICGHDAGALLNVRQAFTLCKYIFKGFELI